MNNVKSGVTLGVLCVLFVVGVFAGFRLLTAPIPKFDLESETSEATCKDTTLKPGSQLSREHVTVDVYNAGTVSGLASQTQRRLSRYGYQRGLTGNADELGVHASNVTLVTSDPRGPMATLLKGQFRGAVRVEKGKTSESTSIAVVIGDRFIGIDRDARESVPVTEPLTVCVPIEFNPTGTD